jgi:hypothetical protein
MNRLALLLMFIASSLSAQDSSFSVLRLRGAALRLPLVGYIADDWKPGTGFQVDVASNLGSSEIALSVGRIRFDPTTGKPPFTETLISLGWAWPILRSGRLGFDAGARLTDVRMNFDDPAMVAGLRHEEEQLISALGRARLSLGAGLSGFVETAYGVLMTSTRTPMTTLAVGVMRDSRMPGWLRDFLR